MFKNRLSVQQLIENFDGNKKESYTFCARLITKRGSSNFTFLDFQDQTGKIQAIVDKKRLNFNFNIPDLFIGDFYCIEGGFMTTKRGEKSISINKIIKISHAQSCLPRIIKNPELVIHNRHLNLAINRKLFKSLVLRSEAIHHMRNYFFKHKYFEADTPILQDDPVVGTATPFKTKSKYLKRYLYLRGSCEIKLKQLISAGYEKVFEIGNVFRNESESLIEFPLLEVEAAYCDYNYMADLVEDLIRSLFVSVSDPVIDFMGEKVDLNQKWKRINVIDAINNYYDDSFDAFNKNDIEKVINKYKLDMESLDNDFRRAQVIGYIIKKFVIKNLIQPTFLMDYPKELSPLAKVKEDNPGLAERGYLFIGCQRVCEVVSEQNNPIEQEAAFKFQDRIYGVNNHLHKDLLNALSSGFPPTGGIGLNINRLIALLVGSNKLDAITFFPLSTKTIS